jgi:hypothetical protein
MLVYFPSFVLSVDTSSNCHLSYEPLGSSALLESLHYVQRRYSPLLYPSELTASNNAKTCSPGRDITPEDDSTDGCNEGGGDKDLDEDGLIWIHPHMLKCVRPAPSSSVGILPDDVSSPSTSSPSHLPPLSFDFKSVLDHLCSLANAVQDLSDPVTSADLTVTPFLLLLYYQLATRQNCQTLPPS